VSDDLKRLYEAGREGKLTRREFLRKGSVLTGLSIASLSGVLAGCSNASAGPDAPMEIEEPTKRYRAATVELGMKCSWCARGADTAVFLGNFAGVEVIPFDGELSVDKQRRDIEDIAAGGTDWDWVQIHPLAIDAYVDPVKDIISKGVPVIDMDTRLVQDLSTLGIVTFLEPDNFFMGRSVTQAMCEAINFQGKVVHTQGALTHTGAQGRAAGFHSVVDQYSDLEVVDETPANWDIDLTRTIWEDLLIKYDDIVGAMFHNDDMALAAYEAIKAVGRENEIVLVSVDGMEPALEAVIDGRLLATVVNPTGRVHGGAFWVGYNVVTGKTPKETVPPFIRTDGPYITPDIAPGILYLAENLQI
jgi:ribose transport system substrate-binding protein